MNSFGGRLHDKKTGELIEPFGYKLDAAGRPIRGTLPAISREEYIKKHNLKFCATCNELLNAEEECEDCASARQGNV